MKQVESLLQKGLIRESTSPWGAPVLFVAKKTEKPVIQGDTVGHKGCRGDRGNEGKR
jgi:hypothetical protein